MTEQEREYYMRRRQCLIMELGAIEDLLGMERSIVPKRKRAQDAGDDLYRNAISGWEPILAADR